MILLSNYFLWLITYSFLGWIYESTICSIANHHFVNRGFLNGPICPVYGFGALTTIFFLYQRTNSIILLFFGGMFLTCTVEYCTAILLEKLFNDKWWDYSCYRFNIQGRICLIGAIMFGILSVLLIKYIHPFISNLIGQIPDWTRIALSFTIFIFIIVDLHKTLQRILFIKDRLQ